MDPGFLIFYFAEQIYLKKSIQTDNIYLYI